MKMAYVLLLIMFFFYNISLFRFANEVYSEHPGIIKSFLIPYIINITWFLVLLAIDAPEAVFMIIYFIAIFLEFKILYKDSFIKNLFGTASFAVNIFAVRLIIISTYSLITGHSFTTLMKISWQNILVYAIAFGLCSLYIVLFQKLVSKHYFNILISSPANILFATKILMIIYLFQLFNTTNYILKNPYQLLSLIELKIGITEIIGFCAAIIYGFILSRLMLFETQSHEMKKSIAQKEEEQKELQDLAYRDTFLGCYNRAFGLSYLKESLKIPNRNFSAVFFDLDGLKTVNDTLGHNEGDEYLKTVVNIIKNSFAGYHVCRMGGDEFLVVLRYATHTVAYQHAVQAFEAVEMLNKLSKKSYPMSVSYGVLEDRGKNKETSEDILREIDEHMYAFKNQQKKARK